MNEWRKQLDFVIVIMNFVENDELVILVIVEDVHGFWQGIQTDDSSLFSGLPKHLGSFQVIDSHYM